ncbi:MAG TPA: tetratricopeptide repeat protein [Caldimonas sp.]|nr:tetratricopeptide repeat protein [Caldimonas sp.]
MDDHRKASHAQGKARPDKRPTTRHLRVAAALASFGVALPMLARAGCQIQTLDLPVKMVGSRAVATVGIGGTPVPLTVDSGAFFSFLTDAAAAQFKLRLRWTDGKVEGLTGGVDVHVTTVENLQLLGGSIPKIGFIVGGNEPGAGTMGLIGRNVLSATDTEYDLAHGVIRFVFPNDDCAKANMAYWAGASPVTQVDLMPDYRSRTPAIRAHVMLNGKELVALFDTGATTIVSAGAARRAGVAEADMTPAGTSYGAGRGSAKLWTARFDKFELGGEAILHNDLEVADFDMDDADMLLGIDFFLSHRIYVSKRQDRMFFTYNGGRVFARNKSESARPATFVADTAAAGGAATTADELERRGQASAARHEYESALADLNRACELAPASSAFFAERGVIQERLKRPAKALEDFDKALELDPTRVDARFQRARLRLSEKNRDGAKVDLDVLDQTLAPQAQMRLPMSQMYLSLEQPARALAQVNQWLPAHPHEVKREDALNTRCWTRLMLGMELDKALDDCDEAIDGDSKNPDYLDSRGWVYLRLGKYEKAQRDFDRSLELRPAGAWSLYGRALTKTRLGNSAQSEADLAAARKLRPNIDLEVAQIHITNEPAPPPTPTPKP